MKITLVFILTISHAFARMTVVRDACENRNWAAVQCQFLDTNPFDINFRAEDDSISRASDFGGHLSTLFEQMESINNPALSCFSDHGRLGRLTNYTRRIINRRPLSNCQKACVVKCITANYLTYTLPEITGPINGLVRESACAAANSGQGFCRGFANLADHLMDEVGLRSQSRASGPHAYNKIWLNNEWFYGEPQDSKCRFFRR